MFLVLFTVGAVLFGWLLVASSQAQERSFQEWQAAAQNLGLSCEGTTEKRTIHGRVLGVQVCARYERQVVMIGKSPGAIEKITLLGGEDGQIPRSLVVRRDTVGRSLGRLVAGGFGGARDEQIGDAHFDELAELSQLDAYVCAALSHSAREKLRGLLNQGGEVRDGVLVLEQLPDSTQDRAWLRQQLRRMAELGAELSVIPANLHQRLAHNAGRDPDAGVRRSNLRFLSDPETRTPTALLVSTARALLSDSDPRVRSLAARQVGTEGLPVLFAIAVDRELDTALRIEALEALGQAGAPGLEPLLGQLLSQPDAAELMIAVLTGVGNLELRSLWHTLVKYTSSEHAGVRGAATRALPRLVHDAETREIAEQVLLGSLSDEAEGVQCASAEALGAIGTVAMVEPLLGYTRGVGRGRLRQAASAAIAQIQARLGDVEAGRVSLSEGSDVQGAVDLADTSCALRVGELSLAADERREPAVAEPGKPHSSA